MYIYIYIRTYNVYVIYNDSITPSSPVPALSQEMQKGKSWSRNEHTDEEDSAPVLQMDWNLPVRPPAEQCLFVIKRFQVYLHPKSERDSEFNRPHKANSSCLMDRERKGRCSQEEELQQNTEEWRGRSRVAKMSRAHIRCTYTASTHSFLEVSSSCVLARQEKIAPVWFLVFCFVAFIYEYISWKCRLFDCSALYCHSYVYIYIYIFMYIHIYRAVG